MRLGTAFLYTLAALVFSLRGLAATELHLRNGDRVTGVLLGRTDGRLIFQSPVLGVLNVPETEAVVVESPNASVESLVGLPPSSRRQNGDNSTASASTSQATPPPRSNETSSAPPVVVTPGASAATAAASRSKAQPWRGKVEFGFQQQSGRIESVNISFRADAERKAGINNYKASGRLLYGEQNDRINSDRSDASLRWRHELGKRTFGQALTSYTADKVKRIDHNFEQNLGAGYRLLDASRHNANVGLGATSQYREALGVTEEFTVLGEFFQDYAYKFNGRLSLLQEANVLYSPESRGTLTVAGNSVTQSNVEAENYRLRFNSTLQGRVTDRVSLNLRFEYEFDNAISNPAAKTDQRITSSVGYAF